MRFKLAFVGLQISIFGSEFNSCSTEPIVHGALGIFRGTHEIVQNSSVEAFRAIPYAKPPIGELRFDLPVSFGPVGDFRADGVPLACLQQSSNDYASEDCLTLNVYRSEGTTKDDRKAVVIVFHGGRFVHGSATDKQFSAATLAAFGDVITVSMNFRIGIFGFNYLKVESGNLAFHDQRLAMRWVHDNIGDFGGNPKRVTLLGTSSGAISVSAQITSALNVNETLFHAAVMDGSVANTHAENPVKVLKRINGMSENFGCDTDDRDDLLKCFRKIPAEIIDRESSTGWEMLYSPMVDNVFISNDPLEFLARNANALSGLKIMIGHAKNEGTFVPDPMLDIQEEAEFLGAAVWATRGFLYKIDVRNSSVQQKLLKEYYNKFPNKYEAFTEFVGDGNVCSVNAFARGMARIRGPVYIYNFERKLRESYFLNDPQRYGVFHTSPFFHFAATPLVGTSQDRVIDAEDRNFLLDSAELIAKFANNDDVPVLRGVQWPDFAKESRVLVIDETMTIRSGLRNENRCKEFFPYFSSNSV